MQNTTTNVKQNLATAYNQHANERNQNSKQEWKITERKNFLNQLNPQSTILEIGSGNGEDSLFFKEQGLDVTCTDLSEENVEVCKSKGLKSYVMDFYNLDFPSNQFDAIWALNCLLHVPKNDLDAVLQGINYILHPQGVFYLGVYGGYDFEGIRENDHYEPKRFFSFYTNQDIQKKVSQHFDLHYFKSVDVGLDSLHFQSMILKKKKL